MKQFTYEVHIWFKTAKRQRAMQVITEASKWCAARISSISPGKQLVFGTANIITGVKYFITITSEKEIPLFDMWDDLRIYLKHYGGFTKHIYDFNIFPLKDKDQRLLPLTEANRDKVIAKIAGRNKVRIKELIYEVKKEEFAKEREMAEAAVASQLSFKKDGDIGITTGDIYQLGDHILICGDSSDPAIVDYLGGYRFALAFADPPYNAGFADYDPGDFVWAQDYLTDIADIVAVTPGNMSIKNFMKATDMPYRWSLACHVINAHGGAPVGFWHWYYTAIFSELKSIHRNAKDFTSITLPPMPETDKEIARQRQKPAGFLAWLIQMFSKEEDWITDPFAGSGQTLLVCESLNRKCITIEIIPAMCEKIIARYESKFKKKAEKSGNVYEQPAKVVSVG